MPNQHAESLGVAPGGAHALEALFARGPIAVLTGAGVSTDSGIPDYRGAGTPPRTPMSIDEFMRDPLYRQRFWAGAFINRSRTQDVEPNSGHYALANLEAAGHLTGVITQNVDDLHGRAGTERLVELHGNGGVIRCVDCDHRQTRHEMLDDFALRNPGYLETQRDAEIAPDGDAIVGDIEGVTVPVCPVCGGTLRPNVVYFGERVPVEVFAAAEELLRNADGLLIAGSSLAVNTGMRLIHRAQRQGIPIAVVNRGPTAVDDRASIRLDAGTSETLTELAERLGV